MITLNPKILIPYVLFKSHFFVIFFLSRLIKKRVKERVEFWNDNESLISSYTSCVRRNASSSTQVKNPYLLCNFDKFKFRFYTFFDSICLNSKAIYLLFIFIVFVFDIQTGFSFFIHSWIWLQWDRMGYGFWFYTVSVILEADTKNSSPTV